MKDGWRKVAWNETKCERGMVLESRWRGFGAEWRELVAEWGRGVSMVGGI